MKYIPYWKDHTLENLTEVFEGEVWVEEWKDIPGFEGFYQASTFGRIKRLARSWNSSTGERKRKLEVVAQRQDPYGYVAVSLANSENFRRHIFAHVLVAITYIENPQNKPQVNHIKGIKTDNRVHQLEWNTASENRKHGFRLGLLKPNKTMLGRTYGLCPHSTKIKQSTLDGRFIKEWSSQQEAADVLKLSQGNIWSALNGRYHSTGGFTWKYSNKIPIMNV